MRNIFQDQPDNAQKRHPKNRERNGTKMYSENDSRLLVHGVKLNNFILSDTPKHAALTFPGLQRPLSPVDQ